MRREEILEAAKICFVERGFAGTRMDDIARRAGLSKGGLYFHFPSKSALMVAVVENENAILEALIDEVDDGAVPLRARVEAIIGRFVGYLAGHLDDARFSQCILDEATRNAEVRDAVRAGEERFLARIVAVLTDAAARGEVALHAPPEVLARTAMVLIEGVKTKFLLFPQWPWPQLLLELRRLLEAAFAAGTSTPRSPR